MSMTNLEHGEKDLKLSNRKERAGEEVSPGLRLAEESAAEMLALRERLRVAKTTTTKDPIPHCGDCYRRGWAAAVKAIEG